MATTMLNKDEDDFYYGPDNYIKLSEDLLEKYPLPDDWTWHNEDKNHWACAVYGNRMYHLERYPPREGRVGDICVDIDRNHHYFKTAEEAYMFVWHNIMLGVVS